MRGVIIIFVVFKMLIDLLEWFGVEIYLFFLWCMLFGGGLVLKLLLEVCVEKGIFVY